MNIEDKIQKLHEQIKEIFPDAVSVEIFVNNDGIKVNPRYEANLKNYSMKNITGKWVKKAKAVE